MKKLKGSTIIEAVISALIILISLSLALTTLVQINAKKSGTDFYYAQSSIDSILNEIKTTKTITPQIIVYKWGSLSIEELKPAEYGCIQLTFKASSSAGELIDKRTVVIDSSFVFHEP